MTILEAIKVAIKAEDLSTLKLILEEEPSLIETVDATGVPLSFTAARTGNLNLVKYIVEYSRASMNEFDTKNQNILHYATQSGNLELVQYLVEKVGLSLTAGDKNLTTPFDIAEQLGYTSLTEYFGTQCGSSLEGMYKNPIRTGMFPDPSIVRVGDDYYMVNSSFIFFPCIPISHSKDLIHWKIIGHAITKPEWARVDDLEGGRGYWAPDISFHKGRYYITATYRLNDTGAPYRKQIVVSADKPEGPYSKPVIIDEDGIDPSIFNDDDGKRYMLLNRGARIFELSEDGTKQISKAQLLYYGDQKRAPEGPHLLKYNGYYYLFLAEGGTGLGHRITVARARSLFGTYEPCPYNPIMRQQNDLSAITRCGHGKPVMTQNEEWFMVYLCGRMIGDGYTLLGRETALDPIQWTADDWPIVNGLKGPSVLSKKPNLPEQPWENQDFDDFDGYDLSCDWMFPRTPESDGYKLHKSFLWLKGSKHPMDSVAAKNILLQRQRHFAFTVETKMGLVDMAPRQEAGMTCYYDENSWLKFGVFAEDSGLKLLKVTEHIGHIDKELDKFEEVLESKDSIYLRITTDRFERRFFYSYDGQVYNQFDILEHVNYLSDEGVKIGKRFTGAMVGLYAYAAEGELVVPFDFFLYNSHENGEKR